MKINHLSVSRNTVWNTCHAQYKYQYHLQLVGDVEEPTYFVYGNIINFQKMIKHFSR